MAALALRTRQDARSLLDLAHERPDVFDSLWYAVFPPDVGGNRIDEIMRGEA